MDDDVLGIDWFGAIGFSMLLMVIWRVATCYCNYPNE